MAAQSKRLGDTAALSIREQALQPSNPTRHAAASEDIDWSETTNRLFRKLVLAPLSYSLALLIVPENLDLCLIDHQLQVPSVNPNTHLSA